MTSQSPLQSANHHSTNLSQFYTVDPNVAHEMIEGEVLAINNATGSYYSMRDTSALVWMAVAKGSSLAIIVKALAAAFPDVTSIAADVQAFVARLNDEALIVPADDGEDVGAVAVGAAYATPIIEIFTDMQDLLLFDPIHEVEPTGWPHVDRD